MKKKIDIFTWMSDAGVSQVNEQSCINQKEGIKLVQFDWMLYTQRNYGLLNTH